MSRCPDARRAEARINEVLERVHTIADIRLIYIAARNESAQPWGITCKHGDLECAGNVQQLCAAVYGRHAHSSASATGDPWTHVWDFVMCQNQSPADIGTPELADKCLHDALFNVFKANLTRECWNGPEAGHLLRGSAAEALGRKATKSATIYIGGAYRCTHDNAEWYDCPGGSEVDDFVATVCQVYFRYTSKWPEEICGPRPAELSAA
ncbi:hypothetical protein HYH02_014924 [Chlamydomonas schloesseri]|uniref:Uncharacterized protein n=1 Tax=Chlamydomonas schloesseri TaxID=2026947 RepID=A0A835VS81_9CHLO|nr:hypothetical protein HYH02_014924 [Chlamydomonas schloesseri]|eukprot:KAG2425860.1 hypothetical protein HYH02_014924 [Chlamydomonas schloesseri]